MNITKYGISWCCGYGFFLRGGSGYRSRFQTSMPIVARSTITTVSTRALKWMSGDLYGLKLGTTDNNPVYVVFDSDTGTWKEYFSGMTVNLATSYSVDSAFDVDSASNYYDVLSVSTPRECNATEFAEGVSKYSDRQIKEIVGQLRALDEDAVKWKREFDAAVKAVKDERAAKEAGLSSVESKLASGFGKYSANSSCGSQGSSNRQTANLQQEARPKQPPTQEKKLQWIRQGRCAFCGSEFKGLFSKVCRECGKAKNYR